MSSRDMAALARKIVALEKSVRTSRASQLPSSSVTTIAGHDIDVIDNVEQSQDAVENVVVIDETLADHGEINDTAADNEVDVPEWIYDSGHSADMAFEAAQIAWDGVDEALTTANDAAVEAAAATETALGLARYSQVDGGPIVPDLPEDGARPGAELVHIDAAGHPYQVDVWNGTEWARSRLLLDQVLVLGPDGTVQIENGEIVSPRITGGVFEGGSYFGGEFIQYASDSMSSIYPENTGDLVSSDWDGGPPDNWGPAGESTVVFETGTHSMVASRSGAGSVSLLWHNNERTPLTSITPRGIELRVRTSAAVESIHVTTPTGTTEFPALAADEWVWVAVDLEDDASLDWVHVAGISTGDVTLYVDQMRVVATALDGVHMRISRNSRGLPGLFIVNSDGEVLGSVTPEGVVTNKLVVEEPGVSVALTPTSGGLSPTGSVTQFAGASAPNGWLLCDGQEVSRDDYAALFGVIGTLYGVGDGVTTFALPNLSGRVPVGLNSGTFNVLGKTGGAETHTLTQGQTPAHFHSIDGLSGTNRFVTTDRTASFSARIAAGTGTGTVVPGYNSAESVGSAEFTNTVGSGQAHNNVQPYLVMNHIIKI